MSEEKRIYREQKEIARLETEKQKPKNRGYVWYLLLIVSLVYMADEVATGIGGKMQTEIAASLFAPKYGHDSAVAKMAAFEIVTYIGVIIGFFYRPLADRYGRKLFLVLNTFGMGLGTLIIGLSFNIPVYLLGACITSFFTPYDMQVVYITETAPEDKRARYYAISKTIATLGMLVIPYFRSIFMVNSTSNWRSVFLACSVLVFVASFLALFFTRETDAFIESRLNYLYKTPEEREKDAKEKKSENSQGGFSDACRLCRQNSQLWYSLIAYGLIYCGITMNGYYTVTMTYGYAKQFVSQGYDLITAKEMTTPFITAALFTYPIGSAFFQLAQGFISDKIGRKATTIIMASLCVVNYLLFYIGANSGWSAYLVGLLIGSAIGCLWSSGDSINMIVMESTPTNMRTSVGTVITLAGIIFTVAQALQLILINVFGDASVGIISALIAVPPMLVGILLLSRKIKETLGTDITNVNMENE